MHKNIVIEFKGDCMIRYILKRILQAVNLLLSTSFIVFTLIHLAPYDAAIGCTDNIGHQEEINIFSRAKWA